MMVRYSCRNVDCKASKEAISNFPFILSDDAAKLDCAASVEEPNHFQVFPVIYQSDCCLSKRGLLD